MIAFVNCYSVVTATLTTITVVLSFLDVLIFVHQCMALHRYKSNTKMKMYIIIFAFTSGGLLCLSSICVALRTISSQVCDYEDLMDETSTDYNKSFKLANNIVSYLLVTSFTFSFVTLYLTFAIKLFCIVENSVHRLSSNFRIFLYVLGIIQLVLCCTGILFLIVAPETEIHNICLPVALLIYILSAIFLCIKFISKLKAMINIYRQAFGMSAINTVTVISNNLSDSNENEIEISRNTISSNNKLQFDAQRMKLINIMTKNTVVVVVAVITSLLSGLFFICLSRIDYAYSPFIYRIMFEIDNTINVTCMYLQWPFAAKYYKSLCLICDSWLKKKFRAGSY